MLSKQTKVIKMWGKQKKVIKMWGKQKKVNTVKQTKESNQNVR